RPPRRRFYCPGRRPRSSSLFPYTTLFRSFDRLFEFYFGGMGRLLEGLEQSLTRGLSEIDLTVEEWQALGQLLEAQGAPPLAQAVDRKSTRLNSSHVKISYAVFCLKKKHGS